MLFKMGKFYEMFEMDAHVGAEVLGLTYMKVGPASLRQPCIAIQRLAELDPCILHTYSQPRLTG
jgi:hypothetical protein